MDSIKAYELTGAYLVVSGYGWAMLNAWLTRKQLWIMAGLLVACVASGLSITLRWISSGQGPFLTLYEVLLSNLFSLGLIYTLAYWRMPSIRVSAKVVLPFLVLLGFWLLSTSFALVPLPATFNNYWLWIHILSGKIFLGTCLVGVGIALVLLLNKSALASRFQHDALDQGLLDAQIWRFMVIAFVAHSCMLVAGAVWANDAWGRYWAWDSLETWVFITWLVQGILLHLKVTFALPHWLGWVMVVAVFVLAFMTFFGIPFLSLTPHRGIM